METPNNIEKAFDTISEALVEILETIEADGIKYESPSYLRSHDHLGLLPASKIHEQVWAYRRILNRCYKERP